MRESENSAWAEISVSKLENNLKVIRTELQSEAGICAVLKADAYGHGLLGIRRVLAEKRCVRMVAVGKLCELVRMSGTYKPDGLDTLVLDYVDPDELETQLEAGNVRLEDSIFSVYSLRQFWKLEILGQKRNACIRVHIRTDGWNSGMGIGYQEFLQHEQMLFGSEYVEVEGLYSHLYSSYSDDLVSIQEELERFDRMIRSIQPEHRAKMTVHILNSILIFRFPHFAYDMVRTGTAIYGLPTDDRDRLQPIMRISARVSSVQEVEEGVPLTYAVSPIHGQRRKIARIPIGYWDCPFLLTQNDVRVLIRGKLFSLADDVCMDNLTVEVSGDENIVPEDIAILLGVDGVTVKEVMARNDIPITRSEWLCMTTERLKKIYQ